MPKYFLVAKDGQPAASAREFSAADLRAYKNSSSCYTFIGELTNRAKNVGACRTRSGRLRDGVPVAVVAPAPAAPKPVTPATTIAGWWFGKKKTKQLPRDPRTVPLPD